MRATSCANAAMREADDDNPLTEDEWPDESDMDDDEMPLVRCPECRRMIAEDSPQCPHCRTWITEASPGAERRKSVASVLIVLVLIGIILVVWHGLGR